jgi:hypothetical protein
LLQLLPGSCTQVFSASHGVPLSLLKAWPSSGDLAGGGKGELSQIAAEHLRDRHHGGCGVPLPCAERCVPCFPGTWLGKRTVMGEVERGQKLLLPLFLLDSWPTAAAGGRIRTENQEVNCFGLAAPDQGANSWPLVGRAFGEPRGSLSPAGADVAQPHLLRPPMPKPPWVAFWKYF